MRANGSARQAGLVQAGQIGGDAAATCVDAQRHWRTAVIGRQQGLPVLRPIGLQAIHPPLGMVGAPRYRPLGDLEHRRLLAHEAAQYCVDECGTGGQALARSGDRVIDQRVIGVGRFAVGPQQRQRAHQQRVDRFRRRLRCQPLACGLRLPEAPQHMKTQRLHARPNFAWALRQHFRQRAPGSHRLDCVGGMAKQPCQRWRRAGRAVGGRGMDLKIHRGKSTGMPMESHRGARH